MPDEVTLDLAVELRVVTRKLTALLNVASGMTNRNEIEEFEYLTCKLYTFYCANSSICSIYIADLDWCNLVTFDKLIEKKLAILV